MKVESQLQITRPVLGSHRALAWIGAGWLLLSLLTAGQVHLWRHLAERPPLPFLALWMIHLVDWLPWALLTPAIVWLVRRFPIGRGRGSMPSRYS